VSELDARVTGPRAVLHVVRQRNFGPYFAGNAISASGTWFQNLAASLLVYRLTGSELLLGALNFSQFIAVIVLAPWAGSAADRFDRKRLLLVTQCGSALISGALAALAFAGHAGTPVVFGASVLLGVASAFSSPAQQALPASLVPPADIQTAVSLNSMTFNIARATGPALAAVVVQTLGIPTAFALNSLSYLALAGALLVVTPHGREKPAKASLRESIALVRAQPRLLVLLLVVAASSIASDPTNTLAPAFAHAFGHRDVVGGYIIGAFGAGAIAAAFTIAGHEMTRRRIMGALVLVAAGMCAFSLAPWLSLGFVFLVVAGFGYLAGNASATARLQLEVGDSQRGRIMALWSIAFLGVRPFASLLDGAIASAAGVRVAGIVMALPALVVAGLLLARERRGIEVPRVAP
jgi:MFS family permease